jgi:hypothetical protein
MLDIHSRDSTGFVLSHTETRPIIWTDQTKNQTQSLKPSIMMTTETPHRVLVIRTLALWAFGAGWLLNLLPVLTHRLRSWSYESLVQKTAPIRAIDVACALSTCSIVLTAASGVREAASIASAAACAAAFAMCLLAAQHSLFYACVLSTHGARTKSRSEISVSLLAALAVATAGCVPAVASVVLLSGKALAGAALAVCVLLLSYSAMAVVSMAHTCEVMGDAAADAVLGLIALALRFLTFGGAVYI